MKKIYSAPVCEVLNVEACEMLASSISSVLPGNGGPATGIMPGEGEFDGEFNSNSESDFEVW